MICGQKKKESPSARLFLFFSNTPQPKPDLKTKADEINRTDKILGITHFISAP
jgi:hypothetical protein